MEKQQEKQIVSVRSLLNQDNVKQKFTEILRENAPAAMANLAVMVNNSQKLSVCQPMSVISAAVIAATLKLPIDPNLGYAYIIPYGDKAQFQIGYKGLIQLAWRTGQYKTINVVEIYDGELVSKDKFKGTYVFDETKKKIPEKVIGYYAYFQLINGGEKEEYWDIDKIMKHAKRFSQTFKSGYGNWNDDFPSMARKTVLKSLLNKWGILSIEMQTAIKRDQSTAIDIDSEDYEYIDNKEEHKVDENAKAVRKSANVKSQSNDDGAFDHLIPSESPEHKQPQQTQLL